MRERERDAFDRLVVSCQSTPYRYALSLQQQRTLMSSKRERDRRAISHQIIMKICSRFEFEWNAYVVLFSVLFSAIRGTMATTNQTDVLALLSLRNNYIGDPFGHLSNWVGDDPCGSGWTGVYCTEPDETQTQYVHELRLLNLNLTGTLAPDLGNLSRLYILDFMWNNISGSIPRQIGKLSNLFLLLLNGNNLTGELPEELSNLANLDRIQIDQNRISGPIPASFQNLNKAKHFHMNNNSISGSIPPELGRLENLVHMLLDNNNLSGLLPAEIANISTLKILQLDNNHFMGSIPSNYSNMSGLLKMSLRNCNLSGTLPDLSGFTSLGYLDVSHNQIEGTLPTGALSAAITTFDVSYNQLSGNIPESNFASLPNLGSLILRNNLLNGTVSSGLATGVRFLTPSQRLLLDFQENQITNNSINALATNVTLRLFGNPYCSDPTNSILQYCTADNSTISSLSGVEVPINIRCDNTTCDSSIGQELNYALLELNKKCHCAVPIKVSYRLKSPGFSYFPYYEAGFQTYLSLGINFSVDQLNISAWNWVPGPRLKMDLKLFPSFPLFEFNATEVTQLYETFTNWLIPDNDTFGPYEILSFALPNAEISRDSVVLSSGALAGIVIGCVVFTSMVVALAMFIALRRRNRYIGIALGKGKHTNNRIKVSDVRNFTFEEMSVATDNFSNAMQIGEGGYGKVYKGVLADGQVVAIKRAVEGSLQGEKEFYTEIEVLSRVHHRNLVSLIGYCDDEGEQMLAYEYILNGTLRENLSSLEKHPLEFRMRLQIALGSARGILYLHTEANPPIYHRDIKSSNILLDENMKAKVADFGISKLAPVSEMEGDAPGYVSTAVKGTPGYLDPEYFLTRTLTDKSDVYSFGVVLLELITGMQPISHGKNIVREVNRLYEDRMMLSIADSSMGSYPYEALEQFLTLAISCCKEDTDLRPSMSDVVRSVEDIIKSVPFTQSLFSFDIFDEPDETKGPKRPLPTQNYPSASFDGNGSNPASGSILNLTPR